MKLTDFEFGTKRTFLRPLTIDDSTELAEGVFSDPEVVKTLVDDWSTITKRRRLATSWIEAAQKWEERGYGIWGVYDRHGAFRAANRLIGVATADELLPKVGEGPEVWYGFRRETWGQGIGSEVVETVVRFLFGIADVQAVEALYYPHINPASLRIAEKLGFNFVGHYPILDYLGKQHHATIDFDLWRIRNCPGEVSEGELSAAALRIGMFVGEGADTFDVMKSALLEAARAGGFIRRIGEIDVERLIREWLHMGVEANGLLLYRLRRDAFST